MNNTYTEVAFSFPQDFDALKPVLADVNTINEGLIAAGETEELFMSERVTCLPEVKSPEELRQTNNFLGLWDDFLPRPQDRRLSQWGESMFGRRPIPDTETLATIMRAYRLIGLHEGTLDDKLAFIRENAGELAILGFDPEDDSTSAGVLYRVCTTHAQKPAFWRMYSLAPDLTNDLLRHYARYNLSDAVAETQGRIYNMPDERSKVEPSPQAGLVAYNVMRLLVDKGDMHGNANRESYLRG